MAKRRSFTDQFKANVALEALSGDNTVQEIAAKHQLHPKQVSTWKRQASTEWQMFSLSVSSAVRVRWRSKAGMQRSGGLLLRMIFIRGAEATSLGKKRAMIKREHPELSITRQCKLVRRSLGARLQPSLATLIARQPNTRKSASSA